MTNHNNAIVVSYPNLIGDCGRYGLRDQRTYFSKYEDGAIKIFELALDHLINDKLDLLMYADCCHEIFEQYYQTRFDENSISLSDYHIDQREFGRRIFDVYRFAKSSLSVLGKDHGLSTVKRLVTNRAFDTGSFLLK
jgi:hypothetical protein